MKCPECGTWTIVKETRTSTGNTRRRRLECANEHRFTTLETIVVQKHQYVRSKKLLKLVAGLDCQACGSGNMVQAAHTNWGGGKGRGVKADDNLVAALCLKCHYEIDQGKELSKEERQENGI
jgi:predicted nucleic-acid-binding Zn-ribbon protein